MIVDFDIKNFLYCFFYILNSGVTKLLNLAGVGENDMIVLTIKIGLFVLRLVFPKLVFSHQSTF